jgi:hypothetical protein
MTAPALSEFERLVGSIMVAGRCSRERAIAAVRLNRPELVPAHLVAAADADLEERRGDPSILEKREQTEIYKLFRAYGFHVRNLSQARASKQAPGLGDAWVVHRERPIAFWWESKRQVGGKLSPAQVEMRDDCARCRVAYHHGDRHDAARLLVQLGLARPGDGPCGIVPFHEAR